MKREPIKWLTQAQVQAAAKKGRKAAIACSQEHWRQLSTATRQDLLGWGSLYSIIRAGFCATCVLYSPKYCNGCPLSPQGKHLICCCNAWRCANHALDTIDSVGVLRATPQEWSRWKRAAKRMYQLLLRCK